MHAPASIDAEIKSCMIPLPEASQHDQKGP